jgi:hypothetical protein
MIMQLPQRNVLLFQRTLDHIHTHPEQHDQKFWIRIPWETMPSSTGPQAFTCDTTGCFAGWAILLTEHAPYFRIRTGNGASEVVRVTASGEPDQDALPVDIQSTAITVLGITNDEADILFHHANTVSFLWHFSQLLCNGSLILPTRVAQDVEAKDWALREWNDLYPDGVVIR